MTEQVVDEQLEALKKWWKENGKFVIIGLVVGIALVLGYYWWEGQKKAANEDASLTYHSFKEQLLEADDPKAGQAEAAKLLTTLRADHADHGYTAFASMLMASKNVVAKDYKAAATELQWVVDNQPESAYEPLARGRLARLHVQMGDCDKAEAVLAAGDPIGFEGLFAQVKGYCLQQGGNVQAARESYREALQQIENPADKYPVIWQLNELGEE